VQAASSIRQKSAGGQAKIHLSSQPTSQIHKRITKEKTKDEISHNVFKNTFIHHNSALQNIILHFWCAYLQ
jgi:hypothetical protein